MKVPVWENLASWLLCPDASWVMSFLNYRDSEAHFDIHWWKLGIHIFSKLISTLKKIYLLLQSQEQPSQRGRGAEFYSVPKCMKDLVISSLLCYPSPGSGALWMKGLWASAWCRRSAWESLTLLVLSPRRLRRLPRVWKYRFLRREHYRGIII